MIQLDSEELNRIWSAPLISSLTMTDTIWTDDIVPQLQGYIAFLQERTTELIVCLECLEWSMQLPTGIKGHTVAGCPSCCRSRYMGHHEACYIAAALKG